MASKYNRNAEYPALSSLGISQSFGKFCGYDAARPNRSEAEAEEPVSKLLTAKRRLQRGLDSGHASATLLQFAECQGLASHSHRFRRQSLYSCLSYNELVPQLGTRLKYPS